MSSAFEPSSFAWPSAADLGDEQVAAVALLLLGGQDDRRVELEAGALPAPGSRRTSRRRRCSPSRQGLGGEQRADAAGAVQDHRRVAVGRDALDLLLDVGLGDVAGAGQVALLPLGRLADVDDGRGARGEGVDLLGGDFTDLRAGLAQEVRVGLRHGWMGSGGRRAGRRMGARAVKVVGGWSRGPRRREPASGRLATPAAALDPRLMASWRHAAGLRGRRRAPRSPRTCWRLSWLSIAHLRRAGLISMPRRSSRSSARMAATSSSGLPLISSVRRLALAWLMAQPRPVNADPIDDAVLDAEHQRDPVAAQRVGALVGRVGVLDDPEVVGPPIVLEDVVAVQVVHAAWSVARTSNSDHIGRISLSSAFALARRAWRSR